MKHFLKTHSYTIRQALLVAAVIIIAAVPHAYNMFSYPYYENDEGTYMSQAWSLITQGKLAPYTYWYDHAPAGWIFLAFWVKLTGGFFTFGPSVNSGRVFMLVLHVFSALLVYFIAKKVTKTSIAGVIAVMVMALSPLGLYFHRRVLLDNIMIFWALAALALLYHNSKKLSTVILSAVCFGIAVLSKENAVFFAPAFLYLIYQKSSKFQREMMLVKWLLIVGVVVSTYFLYAFLKNEFFPVGFMGDETQRVSLITTLKNQFGRGESIPFWDPNSEFYKNLIGWAYKDPFTMIGGIVATVLCFIIGIFKPSFRVPALMSILHMIFLMRGKLVIDFYITPQIPLFGLCFGLVIGELIKVASRGFWWSRYLLFTFFAIFVIAAFGLVTKKQYTMDESGNQVMALDWVKKNIDPDAFIVIDDAVFVDLKEENGEGKKFPNAEWVWKVEQDPEIYEKKLHKDWANIDYIMLSHEMLKQIREGNFVLTKKALDNSYLVKEWKNGTTSYIDTANYISTNGDWMALYKVRDRNKIMLDTAWDYYKATFIKSYGQIVDPKTNNTTSEGQSYAMLRAVMSNDKKTFDNVWKWTQDHLQFRGDSLLSWLWLNTSGDGTLGDSEAASDADEDIALALLMAYDKWQAKKYLNDAQALMNDIWLKEVKTVNGRHYITSGPGSEREEGYLVNPSYFSPAHYRVFAKYDTVNPWDELAEDTYFFLEDVAEIEGNSTGLPPNWVLVNKTTGELESPQKYVGDVSASWYGFDSFRIMWRIYLDKLWFNSPESEEYLKKVKPFFESQVKSNLFAIYSLDGSPRSNYSSLSPSTAGVFALKHVNPGSADEFYKREFESKFNLEEGYWGEKDNYYDQNWAWFVTAIYFDYYTKPF